MAVKYNESQKQSMMKEVEGKVVKKMYNEDDGVYNYWVIEFDDGTEISFKFMAEIF